MLGFNETVRRIEELNKFVVVEDYESNKASFYEQIDKVWTLK